MSPVLRMAASTLFHGHNRTREPALSAVRLLHNAECLNETLFVSLPQARAVLGA